MDRRSFFRTMIGGVAATAAVRTWPFRVYSFPTQPIIPVISPEAARRMIEKIREALAIEEPLPDDVFRPTGVLVRSTSSICMYNVDGGNLGRGRVTQYRRVLPNDDLKKLFAEGWRDPSYHCSSESSHFKGLSRSSQPFESFSLKT